MKTSILRTSLRRLTLGLSAAGLLIAASLPSGLSAASIAGGSTLLSGADANQLEAWLGEGNIILTKIFSTTVGDGKTSTHFHTAADGQGRTFTVVELPAQGGYQRKVIGGYNPQSWSSIGNYNYSGADSQRTAFLFNLTTGALHRQKLSAVDGNIGQYQTYNNSSYGPTFGGGHDLYIDSGLHSGYGYQYSYGPSPAGGYSNGIPGGGQSSLSYGTVEVFTITNNPNAAPTVETRAATGNSSTGATLNAVVSSNLNTTDIVFQYSLDSTLTTGVTTTAVQTQASNLNNVAVSATIGQLTANSTYYFRAVATNALGTTQGSILSFVAKNEITFAYTGSVQTFIVPAGVTSVNVDVRGAQGGSGAGSSQPGLGGRTTATLAVTPGQTLQIYVGGQGTSGVNRIGSVAPGGFNGGGFGGYDIGGYSTAGGGGGASDIRLTSSLIDRVIVAGGGGGGLANGGGPGGSGGGLNGGTGALQNSAIGGGGGTQTAGGTAYTARGATAGTFGQGGNGSSALNAYGSGGGGGGYYGGGGGSGTQDHGSGWSGAGGGGSAYAHPTLATGATLTSGVQSGNGSVIITYADVVANPEIAIEQPAGDANNIANGGSKAFGSVDVGSTSDLVFTLKNTGGSNLTLSGTPDKVALSGSSDFSITAQPTSPVTAAGSTTFTIRFSPTSSGAKNAALSIANNDADENPFVINLTGTGLNTAPVITNNSSAASASLSFAENSIATIIDIDATDTEVPASQTITFSKSGADEALFNIDSNTGVLTFASSRNFEIFSDADSDGIYKVTITATDDGTGYLTDSQDLSITITDVNEMPSFVKGADLSQPALIMTEQDVSGWATAISDGDPEAVQSLSFNVTVTSGTGIFLSQPAISEDGTLSYTLNGTVGTALVSVTLTDDANIHGSPALTTAAQSFTITGLEAAGTGHTFDGTTGVTSGGSIYRPYPGVINNNNNLSFKAVGQAGSGGFTSANDSLLVSNMSGDFQVIGQEASTVAGGGALSGAFSHLILTPSGQTVAAEKFTGTLAAVDQGYLISSGGLSLELLSREGDTAPDGGVFTGHTGRPLTDDADTLYLPGTLSGVASTKNSGVWSESSGNLLGWAIEGDDVSSIIGAPAWLGNFSAPLSAAGDGLTFVAALQNNPDNAAQKTATAGNAAILSGDADELSLVARKGDVIPTVGRLSTFSGVSRSSQGDHAFLSLLAPSTVAPIVSAANDQVLMAVIGGATYLIARENTTDITGSLKPTRFGSFYITSDAEVIYQAWLAGAGVTINNDSVLCRWTVAGGTQVLAREGDAAPGTGGSYLSFQALSVSGGGAVVLQSSLSNGFALMRALPGAGLSLVVRSGTSLTYQGSPRTILSLGIHATGSGSGGGGGGLGAAINDSGAVFTVLSIGSSQYLTRVYRP